MSIDGERVSMTFAEGVMLMAHDSSDTLYRDAEPGCPAYYDIRARGSRGELTYERGLIGVCRDGRIAHGQSGRVLDPRIAASLASIRVAGDPEASPEERASGSSRGGGARGECRYVVEDPAPPLRVRASFSARADIVGVLENGTSLELLERHGRWARIALPLAGWVWTEHLRDVCP